MVQNRAGDALAKMTRNGPHRLDLAMLRIEFLQRSAAKELAVLPRTPEGNFRATQLLDRQRMNTFRRRNQKHARQMFLQKLGDLGPTQIVQLDTHNSVFLQIVRLVYDELANS